MATKGGAEMWEGSEGAVILLDSAEEEALRVILHGMERDDENEGNSVVGEEGMKEQAQEQEQEQEQAALAQEEDGVRNNIPFSVEAHQLPSEVVTNVIDKQTTALIVHAEEDGVVCSMIEWLCAHLPHASKAECCCLHAGKTFLAIGLSTGLCKVFDHNQQTLFGLLVHETTHNDRVTCIRVCPLETFVVVGHESGQLVLWDIKRCHLLKSLTELQKSAITRIDFIENRKFLCVGGSNLVLLMTISQVLLMYVVQSDVLMRGDECEIENITSLSIAPSLQLPAQVTHESSSFIAFGGSERVFLASLQPKPKILMTIKRPRLAPAFAIPQFGWSSSMQVKAARRDSNPDHGSRGSAACFNLPLVIGWGYMFRVVNVKLACHEQTASSQYWSLTKASGDFRCKFDDTAQHRLSECIGAVCWANPRTVFVFKTDGVLLLYDCEMQSARLAVAMMTFVPLDSRLQFLTSYRIEVLNVLVLSSTLANHFVDFSQSVTCVQETAIILTRKGIFALSLMSWRRHFEKVALNESIADGC
eukprot:751276-Hanusia_phi.AAC.3